MNVVYVFFIAILSFFFFSNNDDGDLCLSQTNPKKGKVIIAHGFLRNPDNMKELAYELYQKGFDVFAPKISTLMSNRLSAEITLKNSNSCTKAPTKAVVGFSAGTSVAQEIAHGINDAIFVALDPPSNLFIERGKKTFVLSGKTQACNGDRLSENGDIVFSNASHCDFEAPSDILCKFICGNGDEFVSSSIRKKTIELIESGT